MKPKKIIAPKKKTLGAKKLTTTATSPSKKNDMRIESFEHMEKRAAKEAAEKEDHEVLAFLMAFLMPSPLHHIASQSCA